MLFPVGLVLVKFDFTFVVRWLLPFIYVIPFYLFVWYSLFPLFTLLVDLLFVDYAFLFPTLRWTFYVYLLFHTRLPYTHFTHIFAFGCSLRCSFVVVVFILPLLHVVGLVVHVVPSFVGGLHVVDFAPHGCCCLFTLLFVVWLLIVVRWLFIYSYLHTFTLYICCCYRPGLRDSGRGTL